MGDFDGDGRRDLLHSGASGFFSIYLQKGQDDSDLLTSIWDGDDPSIPNRLVAHYRRTNPTYWTSGTCAYPTRLPAAGRGGRGLRQRARRGQSDLLPL